MILHSTCTGKCYYNILQCMTLKASAKIIDFLIFVAHLIYSTGTATTTKFQTLKAMVMNY